MFIIVALPNRNTGTIAQEVDLFGGIHFEVADDEWEEHPTANF